MTEPLEITLRALLQYFIKVLLAVNVRIEEVIQFQSAVIRYLRHDVAHIAALGRGIQAVFHRCVRLIRDSRFEYLWEGCHRPSSTARGAASLYVAGVNSSKRISVRLHMKQYAAWLMLLTAHRRMWSTYITRTKQFGQ